MDILPFIERGLLFCHLKRGRFMYERGPGGEPGPGIDEAVTLPA